jgi:cysteine-rich repeat protein
MKYKYQLLFDNQNKVIDIRSKYGLFRDNILNNMMYNFQQKQYKFYNLYEECEDGNTLSKDGCSSECLIENNWKCYTID